MAQTCKVHSPNDDLLKDYGKTCQVLFNVNKVRNHYVIEPAELQKLLRMTAEEKKKFMTKDVDQSYAESGEQLNDPIDTFEKIYLIVRNITNRNVKQQYELKKHDIIKLGRVKLKVKRIYIKEAEEEREMKRQKMKRRENDWRRKEIHKEIERL